MQFAAFARSAKRSKGGKKEGSISEKQMCDTHRSATDDARARAVPAGDDWIRTARRTNFSFAPRSLTRARLRESDLSGATTAPRRCYRRQFNPSELLYLAFFARRAFLVRRKTERRAGEEGKTKGEKERSRGIRSGENPRRSRCGVRDARREFYDAARARIIIYSPADNSKFARAANDSVIYPRLRI